MCVLNTTYGLHLNVLLSGSWPRRAAARHRLLRRVAPAFSSGPNHNEGVRGIAADFTVFRSGPPAISHHSQDIWNQWHSHLGLNRKGCSISALRSLTNNESRDNRPQACPIHQIPIHRPCQRFGYIGRHMVCVSWEIRRPIVGLVP
jgi:hypothetical protein